MSESAEESRKRIDALLDRYTPAPKPPAPDPLIAYEAEEREAAEARAPAVEQITSLLDESDWAHAFFSAYLGVVGRATLSRSLKHAGVGRDAYKTRMRDDIVFAALQEQANTIWLDAVEYELHVRVTDGTRKPVHQRGAIVGYVREVDNRLLQWYLERLAPEKYHLATRFEMSGADAPEAFKFAMGEKPLEVESGESSDSGS